MIEQGILKNGNVVAVKRISMSSSRANAEFESEVRLISNVHHRNLIRLLGCCSKSSELLLVLEYMANGSLDQFLYGKSKLKYIYVYHFLSLKRPVISLKVDICKIDIIMIIYHNFRSILFFFNKRSHFH